MNTLDFTPYDYTTPEFSLAGLNTSGRVVSIYDGDTMSIVLPCFNSFYKFTIRLDGIDTCEIKSKNTLNKNMAIKARNKVFELVSGSNYDNEINIKNFLKNNICIVDVMCKHFDKYGRLLANVITPFTNGNSISDVLIQQNLAYMYDGSKKLSEEQQVTYLCNVE